MRTPVLIVGLICAMVTLACGLTINLPAAKVTPGSTTTEEITVPLLDNPEDVAQIQIEFGAGNLALAPGAEQNLITGTATYNLTGLKPRLSVEGNQIRLTQDIMKGKKVVDFNKEVVNQWTLQLGSTPMELEINAGAYTGNLELGGLAIRNLTIHDGAADTEVNFSQQNRVEMDTLRYDTGASKVTLRNLANANFGELILKSGAGEYVLEFTGELQRDARVDIESGLSSITIRVPEGTAARVSVEGGLTNVTSAGSWQVQGKDYLNSGEGPSLLISVNIGAGSLQLENP